MTNEEKDAFLAKIEPDKLEGICNAIAEAVRLAVEILPQLLAACGSIQPTQKRQKAHVRRWRRK